VQKTNKLDLGVHTLVDNSVLTRHFGDERVRGNTKITGSLGKETKTWSRSTYPQTQRHKHSNAGTKTQTFKCLWIFKWL